MATSSPTPHKRSAPARATHSVRRTVAGSVVAWRLVGGAALAACSLSMVAAPAVAHDTLVDATPGDGDVVEGSLTEISLTYSARLLPTGAAMSVTGPDGDDVPLGDVAIDGSEVLVPVAGSSAGTSLPAGAYTLTWRVVSSDGHPITGAYSFTLATTETSSAETDGNGDTAVEPAATSTSASSTEQPSVIASQDSQSGTAAIDEEPDEGTSALMLAAGLGAAAAGLAAVAALIVRRRGAIRT